MKSIILVFVMSLLKICGYSQVKDTLLKSHQDEIILSSAWMDFMTDRGKKTIVFTENNRYFLYEYNIDKKIIFKTEVETFFVDKTVFEEDMETGAKTPIDCYCEAIRAHGKRIQYSPDTGEILAVSKYRHGKRIRFKCYTDK